MATVVLVLIVCAVVGVIAVYNGLIGLRNKVDNAWKQIDVQLKRRQDLVPTLVDTVKGAMQYEHDTLEDVIQARGRAQSATGVGERVAAENALTQSLGRLFALMEKYPVLKANENVLQLQEEITTTENQIAFSRQHYNDVVMQFNTRQQVFPANQVATFFAFKPAEYFSAPEDATAVPRVDLTVAR